MPVLLRAALFALLVLAILGVGYWWLFLREVDTETSMSTVNVPVNVPSTNTSLGIPAPEIIEIESAPDADSDGLSDAEEDTLGTDPNKADSDSDGLSDYDEVRIYESNPLRSDSDGDGITDGDEVQRGFDPNGPGPLLDTVGAIRNFDQ